MYIQQINQHIYIYMHIHIHIYIYLHMYMYNYIYTCVCRCICVCVHGKPDCNVTLIIPYLTVKHTGEDTAFFHQITCFHGQIEEDTAFFPPNKHVSRERLVPFCSNAVLVVFFFFQCKYCNSTRPPVLPSPQWSMAPFKTAIGHRIIGSSNGKPGRDFGQIYL